MYYLDGKKLPSVSTILRLLFGFQYGGIPEYILEKARIFGTETHTAIELYNETGIEKYSEDPLRNHCLNEWIRLKDEYGIEIIASEQRVRYKSLYAGTFDSIGKTADGLALIDYKVTAKLDERHLLYQLNLYKIAYEERTGREISKLYGVWLPKRGRGKVVDIEILDKDELLEEVENALRNQSDED